MLKSATNWAQIFDTVLAQGFFKFLREILLPICLNFLTSIIPTSWPHFGPLWFAEKASLECPFPLSYLFNVLWRTIKKEKRYLKCQYKSSKSAHIKQEWCLVIFYDLLFPVVSRIFGWHFDCRYQKMSMPPTPNWKLKKIRRIWCDSWNSRVIIQLSVWHWN